MKYLKTWLTGACVSFTVITLVFATLNLMLSSDAKDASILSVPLWSTIPCALFMSAAGMLRKSNLAARWIRILSHYIINVLSVFILLYLPVAAEGSTRLVMFFLLTLLYWIIFGICALIRSRLRILQEAEPYAPKQREISQPQKKQGSLPHNKKKRVSKK